jgi:hypothetical protein
VTSIVEFDKDILDSVKAHYENDKLFGQVIQNPERYPLYEINDGLIFFEGWLAIPSNDRISRNSLLTVYHDSQNHFGIAKTLHAIASDYFWPGLSKDVRSLYQVMLVMCTEQVFDTSTSRLFTFNAYPT